jgi:hypothetical protein
MKPEHTAEIEALQEKIIKLYNFTINEIDAVRFRAL